MRLFSYILKSIEKGRAGILPAICRGRDARAPLPTPFVFSFSACFLDESPLNAYELMTGGRSVAEEPIGQ